MNTDLISRRAVLNLAVKIELPDSQTFFCISPEDVEALPSVTPKQMTGHWIHRKMDNECWEECSECHVERAYPTLYCPDCGCKMVEPQESEEQA